MPTPHDVALGLDVGKTAHHGFALSTDGVRLYDRELPQDETALWAVLEELSARGEVLVAQPSAISTWPGAVPGPVT